MATQRQRNRHFDIQGDAHVLTFSCYHRRPYLTDPDACRILLEEIRRFQEGQGFHVWAYAIMPTHMHLLFWPTSMQYSVARLQGFKGSMALRYSRILRANVPKRHARFIITERGKRVFAFWQRGGGYDRNLRDPESIHTALRYIEMNPVRTGLAPSPSEWRWSSAVAAGTDDVVRPLVDRCTLPPL